MFFIHKGKLMSARDVLRELVTENDNLTHDLYKYLAIVSIVTGLGLQIYSIGWQGKAFSMQEFGMGIGALFAGVGIALGLKQDPTTPQGGNNV
jgi:hypothetical protein